MSSPAMIVSGPFLEGVLYLKVCWHLRGTLPIGDSRAEDEAVNDYPALDLRDTDKGDRCIYLPTSWLRLGHQHGSEPQAPPQLPVLRCQGRKQQGSPGLGQTSAHMQAKVIKRHILWPQIGMTATKNVRISLATSSSDLCLNSPIKWETNSRFSFPPIIAFIVWVIYRCSIRPSNSLTS
jgi:hypothetical protein